MSSFKFSVITEIIAKSEGAKTISRDLARLDGIAGQAQKSLAGVAVAVGAVAVAVGAAVREFAQIETALTGVAKTTGLAGDALKKYRDELLELSTTSTPIDPRMLLELSEASGQLGVRGVENLQKFTDTLARLGKASDLQGADAGKTLLRILNVQGEGVQQIERLASVIVALGNDAATTEGEIAKIANRVALSTTQFKLGSTVIAGIATAMSESGIMAELGGSAWGRSMMEVQAAVTQGGMVLEGFAQVSRKTVEQFTADWQENSTEAFIDFLDGLSRFGADAGSVMDVLGLKGTELAQVLIPMAENVDRLRERISQAKAEANNVDTGGLTALAKESNAAFDTMESDFQRLRNVLTVLAVQVGDAIGTELRGEIQKLIVTLKSPEIKAAVRDIAELGGQAAKLAAGTILLLAKNLDLLKAAAAAFVVLKIPALILLIKANLAKLFLLISANPVMAALTAIIAGVVLWNEALKDVIATAQEAIDRMVEAGQKVRTVFEEVEAAIQSANREQIDLEIEKIQGQLRPVTAQIAELKAKIDSIKPVEVDVSFRQSDFGVLDSALDAGEVERKLAPLREELTNLENLANSYHRGIARLEDAKKKLGKAASDAASDLKDQADGTKSAAGATKELNDMLERFSTAAEKAAKAREKLAGEQNDLFVEKYRDWARAILETKASTGELTMTLEELALQWEATDTARAVGIDFLSEKGQAIYELFKLIAAERKKLAEQTRINDFFNTDEMTDDQITVGSLKTKVTELGELTATTFSDAWQAVAQGGQDVFEALGNSLKASFFSAIDAFVTKWIKTQLSTKAVSVATEGGKSAAKETGKQVGAEKGASLLKGGAGSAVATVAIAAAVWYLADKWVRSKKAKKFGQQLTVNYDDGLVGGNAFLGGDYAAEAQNIHNTIKQTLTDVLDAMGVIADSIPEIGLQIRRDGKKFKVAVAGAVLGTFDDLDTAIKAGVMGALQRADFEEIGENVAKLLKQGSLDVISENVDLARKLDNLSFDQAARDVVTAITEVVTQFRQYGDAARLHGLDIAGVRQLLLEQLGGIGQDLEQRLRGIMGGGTQGLDFVSLEKQVKAYNDEIERQKKIFDRITQAGKNFGGGGSAAAEDNNPFAGGPGANQFDNSIAKINGISKSVARLTPIMDRLGGAVDDTGALVSESISGIKIDLELLEQAKQVQSAQLQVGIINTLRAVATEKELILLRKLEGEITYANALQQIEQLRILGAVSAETLQMFEAMAGRLRAAIDAGLDVSGGGSGAVSRPTGSHGGAEGRQERREEIRELLADLEGYTGPLADVVQSVKDYNQATQDLAEEMELLSTFSAEEIARLRELRRAAQIADLLAPIKEIIEQAGRTDLGNQAAEIRAWYAAQKEALELAGAGADALDQLNRAMETRLDQIREEFQANRIDGLQDDDAGQFAKRYKDILENLAEGLKEAEETGIDPSGLIDATNAAIARLQEAFDQDVLQPLRDSDLSDYGRQLKEIQERYKGILEEATALGLSEEKLAEIRARQQKEIDQLVADYQSTRIDSILEESPIGQYAQRYKELQENLQDGLKEALELGLDPSGIVDATATAVARLREAFETEVIGPLFDSDLTRFGQQKNQIDDRFKKIFQEAAALGLSEEKLLVVRQRHAVELENLRASLEETLQPYRDMRDFAGPYAQRLREIQKVFEEYRQGREELDTDPVDLGAESDPFESVAASVQTARDYALEASEISVTLIADIRDALSDMASKPVDPKVNKGATLRVGQRDLSAITGLSASVGDVLTDLSDATESFAENLSDVADQVKDEAGDLQNVAVGRLGLEFLENLQNSLGIALPGVSEALLEVQRATALAEVALLNQAGAFDAWYERTGKTFEDLLDLINQGYDAKGRSGTPNVSRIDNVIEGQTDRERVLDLIDQTLREWAEMPLGEVTRAARRLNDQLLDLREQMEEAGVIGPGQKQRVADAWADVVVHFADNVLAKFEDIGLGEYERQLRDLVKEFGDIQNALLTELSLGGEIPQRIQDAFALAVTDLWESATKGLRDLREKIVVNDPRVTKLSNLGGNLSEFADALARLRGGDLDAASIAEGLGGDLIDALNLIDPGTQAAARLRDLIDAQLGTLDDVPEDLLDALKTPQEQTADSLADILAMMEDPLEEQAKQAQVQSLEVLQNIHRTLQSQPVGTSAQMAVHGGGLPAVAMQQPERNVIDRQGDLLQRQREFDNMSALTAELRGLNQRLDRLLESRRY